MAVLIALAVSLLASIIAIELYATMPAITDWLLQMATRRLSGTTKGRCFEEWQAQLASIPSPLFRIVHALSLIHRAETVAREDIEGYFRDFDAALEVLVAETKKAKADTQAQVTQARAVFAGSRARLTVIRVAILASIFMARKAATAEKLAGARAFLAGYDFRTQVLLQALKAVLGSYRMIQQMQAQATAAICEARVERAKAFAALRRCEDYDTRSPAIAADLRKRLAAKINEARPTQLDKDQAIQNIKDALVALKNGRSLKEIADDFRR